MLISKEVEVLVKRGNIRWVGKIYNVKIGDTINIPIDNLPVNSKEYIDYSCDYCGKETGNTYQNYYKNHNKSTIRKDACKECVAEKRKEVVLDKYGVSNISQLDEVKSKKEITCLEHFGVFCNLIADDTKNKIKNTNQKIYGVDNVAKNSNVKEKARQTNLDRYGVEWTSQSQQMRNNTLITMNERYGEDYGINVPEIRNKIEKTNLDRYGSKCVFGSEYFKDKSKQTIQDKFGVDNVSQCEEIKMKKAETFYKNGTIATSRQQMYIHQLFGGILNYSNNTPSLDIAFPEDKIYIEVNGSGHDLCVKMGTMTQKEFEQRELRRYKYLKGHGWKGIFINTGRDYLPSDDVLLEEYRNALEWFKSTDKYHSHYNIDIGGIINDNKYGRLRRITENDLEEVS